MKKKLTPVANIIAYIVTGVTKDGNRFSNRYVRGENDKLTAYQTAMGINLWNGSVWAELEDGKRKRIKRVIN